MLNPLNVTRSAAYATGRVLLAALLAGAASLLHGPAQAADELPNVTLRIKDGRFIPDTLQVPANTKFKLVLKNEGPGPEEFESIELNKEKVLAAGATSFLIFQPLKPGSYSFFGEFHPTTAKGRIIAK